MPIDYKRYPKNWKWLREQVLSRAEGKCEFCGVENKSIVDGRTEPIKIILTIAHLDHDEENHSVTLDRLRALCQKCHLNYDAQDNKKRHKNRKALGDLFNG